MVLAVGALGTTSFGIVEALKWTGIGVMGFGEVVRLLTDAVMDALRVSYGPQAEALLRAQYRADRVGGELPTTIRQGARIGLTAATARRLADAIGVVSSQDLLDVATAIQSGQTLTDAQRAVLGRYELALDARIEAALSLANSRYAGYVRILASVVSLAIAFLVGYTVQGQVTALAVIIGLAAVPVAPVAKDLAGAIQSAAKAIPRRIQ